MELEHHKEEHGHWSDEEEESEEEEEEMEDLNGNQQVNLVYEEETIFGPEVEKRILLCSQDWLHFLNKSLQTMISGFWGVIRILANWTSGEKKLAKWGDYET